MKVTGQEDLQELALLQTGKKNVFSLEIHSAEQTVLMSVQLL